MTTTDVQSPQVLVVGSGGIAGLYGALLHKAGWQVSIVARSDHAIIREHGLTVESTLGDLSFRPAQVYADTSEAAPHRHVLLAVKMLPTTDLATILKPVVNANTHIILIANGIDIETPIHNVFPNNQLTSGVAFVGSSRIAPGHIHHLAFGRLLLGNFPSGSSDDCQALAQALTEAGISAVCRDHIVTERWKKSVWNASFNPLSVATNGADTGQMLATTESEALVRNIMAEVIEVANSEGHQLSTDLIDANITQTRQMPPYHTSMALDYLNQQPIELDALVGSVVDYANRHKLAIAHLRTLHGILKLRDQPTVAT